MKRLLSSIIIVLLYITVCYGGERRNIKVYDGGKKTETGTIIYEHYTLLDPGECNGVGCVLYEKEIRAFGNNNWIHQFVDINGDGVCDLIWIWKPLVDPTWGTYYSLHIIKLCEKAI